MAYWNLSIKYQTRFVGKFNYLAAACRPTSLMLHEEATMQIFAFCKVANGKQIIFHITEFTNAVAGIGCL